MRAKHIAAALAGLWTTLVASHAVADPTAVVALCPIEAPTSRAAPACSAVYLLSPRGTLVLPGARIALDVSTRQMNLVIRLALF